MSGWPIWLLVLTAVTAIVVLIALVIAFLRKISYFFYLLAFFSVLGYLFPSSVPFIATFLTGYGLILVGIAIEAVTPNNKETNKEAG